MAYKYRGTQREKPRMPCGTNAGHNRHRRAGETPCDACKAAHSKVTTESKRRLRRIKRVDIDNLTAEDKKALEALGWKPPVEFERRGYTKHGTKAHIAWPAHMSTTSLCGRVATMNMEFDPEIAAKLELCQPCNPEWSKK